MTTEKQPAEDDEGKQPSRKKPAAKKAGGTQAARKDEPEGKAAEAEKAEKAEETDDAPASAAKKEPKERHFVDAKTGKTIEKPKQGGAGPQATQAIREEMHAERKGNALPFRIASIVLWVLGIAAEVLAILTANRTLFLPGLSQTTWISVFLVVDLVLVVVGSQLWKRANHLDPASKENKVAYWVQTELGVLIAVIAFAPVILLMLNNKDLDAKTKKLCSIVAGVALVAAVGSGIDYHPTSQEDLDQAQAGAAVLSDDGLAYWTPFGKKYHFNPDCQYLKNSGTIYSGSVQDAIDAGRNEGCSGCTVEDGTDVLANADPEAVKAVLENVVSMGGETGGGEAGVAGGADAGGADDAGAGQQEDLPQAA